MSLVLLIIIIILLPTDTLYSIVSQVLLIIIIIIILLPGQHTTQHHVKSMTYHYYYPLTHPTHCTASCLKYDLSLLLFSYPADTLYRTMSQVLLIIIIILLPNRHNVQHHVSSITYHYYHPLTKQTHCTASCLKYYLSLLLSSYPADTLYSTMSRVLHIIIIILLPSRHTVQHHVSSITYHYYHPLTKQTHCTAPCL